MNFKSDSDIRVCIIYVRIEVGLAAPERILRDKTRRWKSVGEGPLLRWRTLKDRLRERIARASRLPPGVTGPFGLKPMCNYAPWQRGRHVARALSLLIVINPRNKDGAEPRLSFSLSKSLCKTEHAHTSTQEIIRVREAQIASLITLVK